MQPDKSMDKFVLSIESSSQGTGDADTKMESTFKPHPQDRKRRKGIMEKKQEMLETYITVLKSSLGKMT